MKDNKFALIVLLIVAVIFAVLLVSDTRKKDNKPTEIEELEKLEQSELKKIDSLQARVRELDSIILEAKKETLEIDTVIIHERENIKKLPLDSSVNLLKQNILEYESAKLCP